MAEYVEPLGLRILIRKDEARHQTRGGIVLPDSSEIPTITGPCGRDQRSGRTQRRFPIRKYDKVLFHPKNAIPVDFETDNLLFVVPVEDVVAVFRRPRPDRPKSDPPSLLDDVDSDDIDGPADADDTL